MTKPTQPPPRGDPAREEALRILRHNRGFAAPERWVDYALEHRFRRVRAGTVSSCPECGAGPTRLLGRYVHYSNRGSLLECGSCGLIWSDLRLPRRVVQESFGRSFTAKTYVEERRPVFDQMCSLVNRHAPPGGRVLDVGGATGHLMAAVRRRRPDLLVTVNDVSVDALAAARRRFDLPTIRGRFADLTGSGDRYDVVVLADVIYYEPDLDALWSALRELTLPGGTLLIRVPNRRPLIELGQFLYRLAPRFLRSRLRWRGRIPWFNPEHLFVFTRSFLTGRLRRLGYDEVRVLPARPSGRAALRRIAYHLARAIHRASGGRLTTTPSMIVVASRTARDG